MITEIIMTSGFAGITVFFGALAANYFNHHMHDGELKRELVHALMSFGAGVMLAALAFVLLPEGLKELSLAGAALSFLTGSVVFFVIDSHLSQKGGRESTLLAMLLDFIPESLALGAVFVLDRDLAFLLALFIALQNFPEAFNAFRDMVKGGFKVKDSLIIFFCLSFFGIFAALVGFVLLSGLPKITASIMMFASGGILYLLVQDIIPESQMKKHYVVSLGASLGFLLGIIGEKLIVS